MCIRDRRHEPPASEITQPDRPKPFNQQDSRPGHHHQHGTQGHGLPEIQGTWLTQEAENSHRHGGHIGRAKKAVAPNSPTDTAKANPAPTRTARITRGRSTSLHTRAGGAPNTAAASRNRTLTDLNTGTAARTTKGTATREWARGIMKGLVRRSRG